jgi:hypothetical protein
MSMPPATPEPDETFDYNDRYGITPRKSWVAPAVVLAVIGLSWTLWAALNHSQPELRSTIYSFSVTGDREITMKYAIDRRDPDAIVLCTLITLDIDKNIVGQVDDQIVAGQSHVERVVAIPARIAPVSARIAGCRIS